MRKLMLTATLLCVLSLSSCARRCHCTVSVAPADDATCVVSVDDAAPDTSGVDDAPLSERAIDALVEVGEVALDVVLAAIF